MQRLSYLGNVAVARASRASSFESVTEPAGHGEYAEAMRELIAELRPGARGLTADNSITPPARSRSHLRLVR